MCCIWFELPHLSRSNAHKLILVSTFQSLLTRLFIAFLLRQWKHAMKATASSVGSTGIKIPPQIGNTFRRYWEDLAQLRGKIHSIAAASNQIKLTSILWMPQCSIKLWIKHGSSQNLTDFWTGVTFAVPGLGSALTKCRNRYFNRNRGVLNSLLCNVFAVQLLAIHFEAFSNPVFYSFEGQACRILRLSISVFQTTNGRGKKGPFQRLNTYLPFTARGLESTVSTVFFILIGQ